MTWFSIPDMNVEALLQKTFIFHSLCLLIIFTTPFLLRGQSIPFTGQVIDSATMQPLPGVHVFVDKNTGTYTDVKGNYLLELIPGKYQLTFSYIGYQPVVRTLMVVEGMGDKLNVLLKSKIVDLDVAVVTAGRYQQKLSDLTVSLSVMKPAFIENINTISIDQTLNYIPGLDLMDGQASIRGGGGYSFGAGSRVLVLVDGLPMMSAGESEVKWNYLPVENIDQVEVVKGASSALYGSSALNGIINLRTTYPGTKPVTIFNLYGGMYLKPEREELSWWWDTYPVFTGGSLLHSQQFGTVDLVLGANGFIDQGYREENFAEQVRVNVKFRHRPAKAKGLTWGLNSNMQWQHRSDFLIWMDADSGAFLQNPMASSPHHGGRVNVDPWVSYADKHNNRHSLKTRYYRIDNEFSEDADKNNASDLYYGEYQFQKVFRNQLNWTIGMSGQYGESNAALYGDHFNSTIALFTQLDYKFFNRLSATVGLRWENYTMDNVDNESGMVVRAGLNYQAGKTSFIRASFGQGYRFPSIAEKFTATSLAGLNIFPNPELQSETSWSTELGFRQGFRISNWKAFLDAAVFWSEYNNMIEFTFGLYPADTNDIPTIEDIGFKSLNIGKARITGVEIEITGDGHFGKVPFKTFLGYTYMNPLDLSSDTLSNNMLKYRYHHSFKGDVEFNFRRFSAGLSFIYRSFMERIDEAFEQEIFGMEIFPGLKDYREENNQGSVVFDLRASFLLAPSTRLSFIFKNLFNEEYMGRPGDIRPPRNITLQLLVKI